MLYFYFLFLINSFLLHVYTSSGGSSIVFLTNATSSANIALGLAGVLSYDDSFACDRWEYESGA